MHSCWLKFFFFSLFPPPCFWLKGLEIFMGPSWDFTVPVNSEIAFDLLELFLSLYLCQWDSILLSKKNFGVNGYFKAFGLMLIFVSDFKKNILFIKILMPLVCVRISMSCLNFLYVSHNWCSLSLSLSVCLLVLP